MDFEMQSPLEQLWSLLNFGPDVCFQTMGEVRAWRENAIAAKALHAENLQNASNAIDAMIGGVDRSNTGGQIAVHNLRNFQSTIIELSNMVIYCWERDLIAMEVFLDLPAGFDPSLN